MMGKIKQRYIRFRELQREGLSAKTAFDSTHTTTCLSCGNTFHGAFCPRCGQKAATGRLSVSTIFRSVFTTVFLGDSAFVRTLCDLLWRPGYLIADYLRGKRSCYTAPLSMLARIVAIYLLAVLLFGVTQGRLTLISDDIIMAHVNSQSLSRAIAFLSVVLSNSVLSSLLWAFVFVLPFNLLFARCQLQRTDGSSARLNVAEHFYALVYVACLRFIISVVIDLLLWMGVGVPQFFLSLLLPVLLPAWAYRQLLSISWLSALWRSILAIILVIILLAILTIFSFGIFYGIDAVR